MSDGNGREVDFDSPRASDAPSPNGSQSPPRAADFLRAPPAPANFDSTKIFETLAANLPQESCLEKFLQPAPIAACFGFVVHPHRKERLAWDFMVLLLVLYAAFNEPYKAAFLEQTM
eukprot:SAG22_NODE_9258_length_600_cov_1.031936_1_plen_116_part_10